MSNDKLLRRDEDPADLEKPKDADAGEEDLRQESIGRPDRHKIYPRKPLIGN